MVISLKKSEKKKKKEKKFDRNKALNSIIIFIKKYYYILLLALPFILIDLFTRYKVKFYGLLKPVPNLFTIIWITLLLGISLYPKKKIGKIIYSIIFVLSLAIYLVNNVYFSMTGVFFDFSMVLLAGEGSEYLLDSIKNCDVSVYLFLIPIFITFILAFKVYPNNEKRNYKRFLYPFIVFIVLHTITPLFLGKANEELTWSTWRNPRNIYNSFNDNNKSMTVSGIYEYTARNFYITFLKNKNTTNEEDIKFLKEEYSKVGYKVIVTSAKENKGIEEVKEILKNKVSVFSGNSGVGKSSLINAIFDTDKTQEGEVSKKNKKGKNTTTDTKLYEIEENSYIADTPGFSSFEINEIESSELDKYFIEIEKELGNCEFVGCTHIKEEKCGVKQAVQDGKISQGRYERFCEIYNELKDKEKYIWK